MKVIIMEPMEVMETTAMEALTTKKVTATNEVIFTKMTTGKVMATEVTAEAAPEMATACEVTTAATTEVAISPYDLSCR